LTVKQLFMLLQLFVLLQELSRKEERVESSIFINESSSRLTGKNLRNIP
jgi:hypothetical protein